MSDLNLDLTASEKHQEKIDAERYRYLRNRDAETISKGGIFAGQTPQNLILTGIDLDKAIDAATTAKPASWEETHGWDEHN